MLDARGMDSPRPQYPTSPCRLTSAPHVQTTKARFTPLQSHSPSLVFKNPPQQRALSFGTYTGATGSECTTIPSAHSSLNTIHVEKSIQPAGPKAKIARISQTKSKEHKSFKDILQDVDLCRTNSPNTEIHAFREVSHQDFEALVNIVEKWSFPQRKPKLSYHPSRRLLIVEMPTPAHEFAITEFSSTVQPVLNSLPIDKRRLRIRLEASSLIRSTVTGFVASPDLALIATSTGGGMSYRRVFAMVECAFTQDRDALMKKIQDEVEGWPEIAFVLAVFVSEVRDYRSPLVDSPTWHYFAKQESLLDCQQFLSLPTSIDGSTADPSRDRPSAISGRLFGTNSDEPDFGPVTIAGHTWCEIRNVQYRIWVKKDGVLDIDGGVTGYLWPNLDMEDVEQAINDGLSAVKSGVDEVAAKLAENMIISATELDELEEAELRAEFNWHEIQWSVKMAAEQTASSRYETWFSDNFRGTKRSHPDDRSYSPSTAENSDSSVRSLEPEDAPTVPRYLRCRGRNR